MLIKRVIIIYTNYVGSGHWVYKPEAKDHWNDSYCFVGVVAGWEGRKPEAVRQKANGYSGCRWQNATPPSVLDKVLWTGTSSMNAVPTQANFYYMDDVP